MRVPNYVWSGICGVVPASMVWCTLLAVLNTGVPLINLAGGIIVAIAVRVGGTPSDSLARRGVTAIALTVLMTVISCVLYSTIYAQLSVKRLALAHGSQWVIQDRAIQIAKANESAGDLLAWPEGHNVETATKSTDFPPEIWSQATADWEALPEPEKRQCLSNVEPLIMEMVRQNPILFGMTMFDGLFGGKRISALLIFLWAPYLIASKRAKLSTTAKSQPTSHEAGQPNTSTDADK